MSQELLAKYEALVPILVQRQHELRRARKRMFWLLVVGAVTVPLAWPFGLLALVCDVTLWVTLWGTGVYIATMYDWGYERQIVAAQAEIAQLAEPEDVARAGRSAPAVDAWRARRVPRQVTWGVPPK